MLPAALRACAAGLYPGEASVELLISHGGFLHRRDFGPFVRTGTSITDGTTPMAQAGWDAAITALHAGRLPVSGRSNSASSISPPASPPGPPSPSATPSPAWTTATCNS